MPTIELVHVPVREAYCRTCDWLVPVKYIRSHATVVMVCVECGEVIEADVDDDEL